MEKEKILKMIHSKDDEMCDLGLKILIECFPNSWKTLLEQEYIFYSVHRIYLLPDLIIIKYLGYSGILEVVGFTFRIVERTYANIAYFNSYAVPNIQL